MDTFMFILSASAKFATIITAGVGVINIGLKVRRWRRWRRQR